MLHKNVKNFTWGSSFFPQHAVGSQETVVGWIELTWVSRALRVGLCAHFRLPYCNKRPLCRIFVCFFSLRHIHAWLWSHTDMPICTLDCSLSEWTLAYLTVWLIECEAECFPLKLNGGNCHFSLSAAKCCRMFDVLSFKCLWSHKPVFPVFSHFLTVIWFAFMINLFSLTFPLYFFFAFGFPSLLIVFNLRLCFEWKLISWSLNISFQHLLLGELYPLQIINEKLVYNVFFYFLRS